MTQITDMFKPEIMFSRENPFLKAAEKSHRLVFETFDKAAHLQLACFEDLLDLNRRRFESLYADEPLKEKLSTHQDLATEAGKRAAALIGDMQEAAVDLQSSFSDAASEFVSPKAVRKPASKSRKSKAA
jgi:hypothetical protein